MGRSVCRVAMATALLCCWIAGCASSKPTVTKQPKPPPPDPLLMSKKPIEGRPHVPADYTAQFDPTPPAMPTLPPLPAGAQFAAPGLQRDPIQGVQIGFMPLEDESWARPELKPTANSNR